MRELTPETRVRREVLKEVALSARRVFRILRHDEIPVRTVQMVREGILSQQPPKQDLSPMTPQPDSQK